MGLRHGSASDSLGQQIQQLLTEHLLCVRHCFWHWGYSSGHKHSYHQACGQSRVGRTDGVLLTHLYRTVWGGGVQDSSTASRVFRGKQASQVTTQAGRTVGTQGRVLVPSSCCLFLRQCLLSESKKKKTKKPYRALDFCTKSSDFTY